MCREEFWVQEAYMKHLQQENGCNADQYFRNREAVVFALTRLLIDQIHFSGHVTCSENYNTRTNTLQIKLHIPPNIHGLNTSSTLANFL